jgi:hypothetical protein
MNRRKQRKPRGLAEKSPLDCRQEPSPSVTSPVVMKNLGALRVCAKTIAGKEAYFEQNDPLPSDGRGNSLIRLLHFLQRLDTPTDGGRFSLSHPMGEGRGEGECFSESEVVFARVLSSVSSDLSCLNIKFLCLNP